MDFIPAKTIVSGYTDKNSWFGCNYNMNIYKGCSHGCIYCDSRSECYRVENFDVVRAKTDALALIDRELAGKRRSGVIGTGSMSDPYNPEEVKFELTRGALKLINQYGFGVSIATKSALVARDIDLLQKIQRHSPVLIKMTLTTIDDALAAKLEPNVSSPSKRLEAIKKLSDAGIFTGILMMPILPFIEDSDENIEGIIRAAHACGAKFVYPGFGVTLRQNQRDWYFNKLDELFPGMKQRYLHQFGGAYQCASPRAKALSVLCKGVCKELGMLYKMSDIIAAYRAGYGEEQLTFF